MKKNTLLLIALILLFSACISQTATPTAKPTAEATANPTAEPTAEPTLEPTSAPTMPPWTQDYEYEYKPYIISDTTRQVFGDKAVELACDIIDAYIAYETSVPAADEDTAIAALSIAVRNFPPFDAFTRFNEYTAYKDGRVSWKNVQTKEEHDKMLVDFQKCIESYMKVRRKGDCETARAMALYKELLTGSWYNSSFDGKEVDKTPIELTTYYFLLNRSGIMYQTPNEAWVEFKF